MALPHKGGKPRNAIVDESLHNLLMIDSRVQELYTSIVRKNWTVTDVESDDEDKGEDDDMEILGARPREPKRARLE